MFMEIFESQKRVGCSCWQVYCDLLLWCMADVSVGVWQCSLLCHICPDFWCNVNPNSDFVSSFSHRAFLSVREATSVVRYKKLQGLTYLFSLWDLGPSKVTGISFAINWTKNISSLTSLTEPTLCLSSISTFDTMPQYACWYQRFLRRTH